MDLSHADTGVSFQTKAPYIADSVFHENTTAINQTDFSPAVIRGCAFDNNNTGVRIAGGDLLIAESIFTNNGTAMSDDYVNSSSSYSSPKIENNLFDANTTGINLMMVFQGHSTFIITGNTFTNQKYSYALNINDLAVVQNNRIVNNYGGVITNGSAINFSHNLVANNGSQNCTEPCDMFKSAVTLQVNSNLASSISPPELVYNPDRNEYLAVWSENGNQVKAQRLAADGSPLGMSVVVGQGFNPVVSYNPDAREYLVAYIFGSMGTANLKSQRVSELLNELGSPISLAGGSYPSDLRLVYQSGESLSVLSWREYPNLKAQYI